MWPIRLENTLTSGRWSLPLKSPPVLSASVSHKETDALFTESVSLNKKKRATDSVEEMTNINLS